jgi:gluconate 2-dehydrogenase gamma chain
MPKQKLDRRTFFMTTGVSIGGAALLYSCHQPGETWSYLQEAEARILDAMLDQIIPGDKDPGARDAGVIYFVDRQLTGPYKRYQRHYRNGLKNLEATSQAVRGESFYLLSPQDQTAILESLERNEVPPEFWSEPAAASFFNLVVDHAMQGFYGSPIHGGNKDFVSYRMLGIDLPIDYDGSQS